MRFANASEITVGRIETCVAWIVACTIDGADIRDYCCPVTLSMVEMSRVLRVPISGVVVRAVGVWKITWCVAFSEFGAVSGIESLIG